MFKGQRAEVLRSPCASAPRWRMIGSCQIWSGKQYGVEDKSKSTVGWTASHLESAVRDDSFVNIGNLDLTTTTRHVVPPAQR